MREELNTLEDEGREVLLVALIRASAGEGGTEKEHDKSKDLEVVEEFDEGLDVDTP